MKNSIPNSFDTIKAAEAAGYHRLTEFEYGGEQITVKGVLLGRNTKHEVGTTKVAEMYPSQVKAFNSVRGKSRVICNMPTGWGKSFLLVALCGDDLCNANRKVILCVPQKIIAKGFKASKTIRLPDGKIINWKLPQNLCDTSTEKVKTLLAFLRNPPGATAAERAVLVTHASLTYAFNELTPAEVATVFHNATLVIDEAQHVQTGEVRHNELGKVMTQILDQNDRTTKVVLATAYFFRGDHLPIIGDTHLSRFDRYHVPFDEYWESLKYLKTYLYDFVAYKGTVFTELSKLLTASDAPTIIYCPPEGHKMLLDKGKTAFVSRVKNLTCRLLSAKLWSPGVNAGKVIVDLVEDHLRNEKISYINAHGNNVAAVLTVGMFKEGADWIEASRIIDLVPSGSDQDRLQRFGRLSRDCPKKCHVSYYSLFPLVVEDAEETRRLQLSKLYAHFHASLILHNAIRPIKIKVPKDRPLGEGQSAVRTPNDKSEENLMGTFSEKQQEAIIRDSYEALIKLQDQSQQDGKTVQPDEVKETLVRVLTDNGVTKHTEETAKQILIIMRRQANVRLNSADLLTAGFDKIYKVELFDGLFAYSAGFGGPTTFAEIRKVVESVFDNQWMENFSKIKDLPAIPQRQSSIYWWMTNNRVLHKGKKLSRDRVALLETIPWWEWSEAREDRWQSKFDELAALSVMPSSGPLNKWAIKQRLYHSKKTLEPYRAKLLESIHWWEWSEGFTDRWQQTYEIVKTLPEPPKSTDSKLYFWVNNQRLFRERGSLDVARIKKLESISWWTWGKPQAKAGAWQKNFTLVKKLKAKPGYKDSLYEWAKAQRTAYKSGLLDDDRKAKLESIPWWEW